METLPYTDYLMLGTYHLKNNILATYGDYVTPIDFYRDMFPEGSFEREGAPEDSKANGILCSIKDGKGKQTMVFDDLQEIIEHLDDEFVIISPIAYFGKRRTAYNASLLYGIAFDIDDVEEEQLRWILERLDNPEFPQATYIANSGKGIHMYYLFDRPIPLYKSLHKKINRFKADLTKLLWNKYTSRIKPENRQIQSIFQGFRMVGSRSKIDKSYTVCAYKTGDKVSLDYLNKFVSPEFRIMNIDYESSMTLEEAKEKYPDWYERRILEGRPKENWHVKRDLYDWWLRKVKTDEKLRVGHRYFCVCALAAYARKCSFYDVKWNPQPVTEEELRRDAYLLLPHMNKLQNDFTEDDIEAALTFFQESYITFPRDEIEKISGLEIKKNRRNGRTQEQHLKIARYARDLNYTNENGWAGRKSKEAIVRQWRASHPNGTKTACHRDTGLSRTTIDKWWNEKM